ncbi:hypothetical protein DC439_24515 (plasmid) [Agrobacterium tumefaciens]|nr:hypothetical protein DC439_24515 [Agrobacterium tumefaciens]
MFGARQSEKDHILLFDAQTLYQTRNSIEPPQGFAWRPFKRGGEFKKVKFCDTAASNISMSIIGQMMNE